VQGREHPIEAVAVRARQPVQAQPLQQLHHHELRRPLGRWHDGDEPSAGAQRAANVLQGAANVGDVLEAAVGDRAGEERARQVNRADVAADEGAVDARGLRPLHLARVDVDAPLRPIGVGEAREEAVAAPDVEDGLGEVELAHGAQSGALADGQRRGGEAVVRREVSRIDRPLRCRSARDCPSTSRQARAMGRRRAASASSAHPLQNGRMGASFALWGAYCSLVPRARPRSRPMKAPPVSDSLDGDTLPTASTRTTPRATGRARSRERGASTSGREPDESARPWLRASSVFVLVLVAGKAVDLDPSWPLRAGFLLDVLTASHEDVLFGTCFCSAFALVGVVARRAPSAAAWPFRAFVGLGAVGAAYTVVACRAYPFLWGPITYRVLAVAGGGRGVWSIIRGAITREFVAALLLAPAVFVLSAAGRAWRPPGHRLISALVPLVVIVAALVVAQEGRVIFAHRWSARLDRPVAQSPHVALVRSLYDDPDSTGVARGLDFPFGDDERLEFARPIPSPPPITTKHPRGVILYVMESTGAEYLDDYGAASGSTPRFSEIAGRGMAFDHAYANLGRTEAALATLLTSQYLPFSWQYFTEAHLEPVGPTLARAFRDAGYFTAFVSAGDLEYASQRTFLDGRGFDLIVDGEHLGCPLVSRWGVADACAVDGALAQIDAHPRQPFFILVWTNQTHHPYVRPVDAPSRRPAHPPTPTPEFSLDDYRGALAEADRQLGRLLDGLRARELGDDVLLAVTGDHSEAFGSRHKTFGHGFHVYDEEMRVPLVLRWPAGLPGGTREGRPCAHVDVAPTLAHLAGIPQAPTWFGRSVLDPSHPGHAYLTAVTKRLTVGIRERSWKLTVVPSDGQTELYDMDSDPGEQHNLVAARPEIVTRLGPHLAAWVAVTRAAWRQGDLQLHEH